MRIRSCLREPFSREERYFRLVARGDPSRGTAQLWHSDARLWLTSETATSIAILARHDAQR